MDIYIDLYKVNQSLQESNYILTTTSIISNKYRGNHPLVDLHLGVD